MLVSFISSSDHHRRPKSTNALHIGCKHKPFTKRLLCPSIPRINLIHNIRIRISHPVGAQLRAAARDLESHNILRPLDDVDKEACAAMPRDMAMEGPGAGVVGVDL